MRKVVAGLLASLIFTGTVAAQVTAEIVLDQEQFIPGETVPVSVRIVNRSGQTLKLGAEPDWLTFTVEDRTGDQVERTGTPTVLGEFTLESSKKATKTVDLSTCYALTKPGRYKVSAVVRIPGWDHEVVAEKKVLQVSSGTKIWEAEFGVPNAGGQPPAPPQVRTFALFKSAQLERMTLYARVSDQPEGRLVRLSALGPLVSFSTPEAQVDRFCNLHVLWQSGARIYLYATVNPQGQLLVRQTYDFAGTRPRLGADDEGRIRVLGGQQRETPLDLPPK